MNRCIGCGEVLQTSKELEVGYTPNINNKYCKRCFRLKNYGEEIEENNIDNDMLIKKINKKKGIVFFLIDYLNINKETISYFKKINLEKVLIISKCDILRKDMKFLKIKKWLKEVYKIDEDIYFASGKSNYININIFKYTLNKGYNTCYMMGITNAGKSTLVNYILRENNIRNGLVISKKVNTTRDFIKFKVGDIYLYDTPGFIYQTKSLELLDKEIKPITYNITKSMSIKVLDYYFYFDKPNKITLYLSTKEIKKEFKEYTGYKYEVKDNQDLVIPGVGFINVKRECGVISNLDNIELRKDLSGV